MLNTTTFKIPLTLILSLIMATQTQSRQFSTVPGTQTFVVDIGVPGGWLTRGLAIGLAIVSELTGLCRRVLSWSVGWVNLAASWDIGLAEPWELVGDIKADILEDTRLLVVVVSLATDTNNPGGCEARAAEYHN